MKKVAPERTCPVCLSTWRHDRAGAPPKLCTECRLTFAWCSTGAHAVPLEGMADRSRCRDCHATLQRTRALSRVAELARIKVERGCVDCGFNAHPAALDFDHRPGVEKRFNISEAVRSRGWEEVLAEVEKCDVRCANCHRIITAERLLAG